MGFKIMKCPACGGDLNIETDRDFLFCQFCGAKLMKDDQRIVIEHIERRIDEAEIEKQKLNREEAAHERKSAHTRRIISGILLAIGTVLFAIGMQSFHTSNIALVGEFIWISAGFLFMSTFGNNRTNQQK